MNARGMMGRGRIMKQQPVVAPRIIIIVMSIACLYATAWLIVRANRLVDVPYGCDDFGYLRQAKLFVEHGFILGLDTSMNDPAAKLVVELSKNSGIPAKEWYQGVGPHAHHYKVLTDKIIDQYPPGTGFFMSFFPEGQRNKGWLLLAGGLVIGFAWTVSVVARGEIMAASLAAVCGAVILPILVRIGSSIPVTTGLSVVLCFLLGVMLTKDLLPWAHPVLALACGLVFGALVDVRLPNALIFPGILLCLCSRRQRMVLSLAAFGLGAAAALTPLGWANIINAGGLLHATYSSIDASSPVFNLAQITKAARFYMLKSEARFLLPLALFCIALSWRRSRIAAYAGLIVIASEIAYFFTHEVLTTYYLLPGLYFAIFLCLISIAPSSRRWLFGGLGSAIFALCVSLLVVQFSSTHLPFQLPGPGQAAELKKGVVWAEVSGGLFGYYLDIDTPKIRWTPKELQYSLIEKVRKKGMRQFFVDDCPDMDASIKEYAARFPIVPAGKLFGKDVYRLEPAGNHGQNLETSLR